MGNFGNYGADSEVEQYLQNDEETQGYEELQNQTDVAAFKVFPKEQILRDSKGKFRETLNNSKAKVRGGSKSSDGFKRTKANVEQKGERKQTFEEKQSRLEKVEGIKLKCDFEHRRSGWSKSENTAACSECGNTDRFKA